MLSSGSNKPMNTINAKTHHDFVNPIYPASTKVDMMLFLHTLCLFCSIRIVSCNAKKYQISKGTEPLWEWYVAIACDRTWHTWGKRNICLSDPLEWPHLRQLTFATAGAGGPQHIGVGGGQASKHGQRLRLPGTWHGNINLRKRAMLISCSVNRFLELSKR